MIANAVWDQLAAIELDRQQAHSLGRPALERLATVARRNSCQARTVGRFLLALYNGQSYPFDLTLLRGLDLTLFNDCMAVLHLDYHPDREVQEYLTDGPALFSLLRENLTDAGGVQ